MKREDILDYIVMGTVLVIWLGLAIYCFRFAYDVLNIINNILG